MYRLRQIFGGHLPQLRERLDGRFHISRNRRAIIHVRERSISFGEQAIRRQGGNQFTASTERGIHARFAELGIYWAKGFQPLNGNKNNPDLTFRHGEIMPTASVHAIFWGPSWADPVFDGDKITGLETFYLGFGGSGYAHASNEYTGSNGQVTSVVSYTGYT